MLWTRKTAKEIIAPFQKQIATNGGEKTGHDLKYLALNANTEMAEDIEKKKNFGIVSFSSNSMNQLLVV